MICHLDHQDSSTTSHGLQSSFFSKLHLYFIFVAFSLHLADHVPINRATNILMVTLELLIDASV